MLLQFHDTLCTYKLNSIECYQYSIVSLAPHEFLKMDVGLGFILTKGRFMYKSVT